jgi:ABC-type sulfate transport system substrate-binding protein
MNIKNETQEFDQYLFEKNGQTIWLTGKEIPLPDSPNDLFHYLKEKINHLQINDEFIHLKDFVKKHLKNEALFNTIYEKVKLFFLTENFVDIIFHRQNNELKLMVLFP